MKVELDHMVYKSLLQYKQSLMEVELKAEQTDLAFLQDDLWLQDSAVIDRVVRLNGRWQVFLVFAHYKNPMLLIKRFIKTQISSHRAKTDATYMKRLAAKDQRGTLEVNVDLFDLCSN